MQLVTTFSAGNGHIEVEATARQLIEHLASAQPHETIRQTGLDPVKTPQQIAFTRVFPNAGQIGLFIAAADGSGGPLFDWLVSTTTRRGRPTARRWSTRRIEKDRRTCSHQAGWHRPRAATDDPAYDDQAAFSPDGLQLVFVSTRNGGYARIWTMNLRSRQVKAVTTTTPETGMGGDFRPAWSPDGRWLAFSSDRA